MAVNLSSEAGTLLVKTQLPRIQEDIAVSTARRSAWLNVLEGGTVDLVNEDNTWTTLVQNHASPAGSYIRPAFVEHDATFTVPTQDEYGQTQFQDKIYRFDGRGPTVYVNKAYHLVKSSLAAAEKTQKDLVVALKNNDVRINLYDKSGVKAVCTYGGGIDQLTGGRNITGTSFKASLPTGEITFSWLKKLAGFAHENYETEMFGAAMNGHCIGIGGYDIVEKLRNEGLISGFTTNLTQGGFTEGVDRDKAFFFTDFQNQGIRMAIDQFPLRYNDVGTDGQPILLESHQEVNADQGKDFAVSNLWLNAQYEIFFLIFKDSFRYKVPASYTGEGSWKWAPHMAMGELYFRNILDNNENLFGDFGYFIYRMKRLLETVTPHAVVPIAFRRSAADWGADSVSSSFS